MRKLKRVELLMLAVVGLVVSIINMPTRLTLLALAKRIDELETELGDRAS